MADYYSQCVVSPMLPLADVTAAEQLVLRNMFDSELEGDELYLFAEIGRNSMIGLEIPEILAALSSTGVASAATRLLSKAVADLADAKLLPKSTWTIIGWRSCRRSWDDRTC